MQTLIIDSGGTKAEWVFLDNNGKKASGSTPGIHPFFLTENELSEQLEKVVTSLPSGEVHRIFHYGTGTNSIENCARLQRAYQHVFPEAEIEINTDLLAVARALCGQQNGIAVIMGTGSNAGLYDGTALIKTTGGLGYALGDEGSGAYMGKQLLNYFLNGLLPTDLSHSLREEYELTRESIVESVYRKPFPNRYLASMAPFLSNHLTDPFIWELVLDAFRAFFQMNVQPLQGSDTYPLYFVGSVAFHFSKPLYEIADEFGMDIGKIAKTPIEGLINYHLPN